MLLPLFFPVALRTLEHRNVAQIQRMLEGLVGFMTTLAFPIAQRTQINRVLERAGRHGRFRVCRVVKNRVTDIAVGTDRLAGITYMLSIMTTEAAAEIEMTDIVRMCLPVGFHLREEIGAEYSLDLLD